MVELKRPVYSLFCIASKIGNVSALNVYAHVQNITPGSTNYLKFWNMGTSEWQTAMFLNPVTEIVSNPGLYVLNLNHVLMQGKLDDLYVVSVSEATQSYNDTTYVRFGDATDASIQHLIDFVVPARKEIRRITDQHMQVSSYNATVLGDEVLRVDITHDTSGAQPEEVQVFTTSPV